MHQKNVHACRLQANGCPLMVSRRNQINPSDNQPTTRARAELYLCPQVSLTKLWRIATKVCRQYQSELCRFSKASVRSPRMASSSGWQLRLRRSQVASLGGRLAFKPCSLPVWANPSIIASASLSFLDDFHAVAGELEIFFGAAATLRCGITHARRNEAPALKTIESRIDASHGNVVPAVFPGTMGPFVHQ